MKTIDWKQIAKDNDLTYYELMDILIHTTAAHMDLECDRNIGDIMELIIEDFGTLKYTKEDK